MAIFPKIDKITKDITLIHFFLMFGYQMFSPYFPLFLAGKNFSLEQIGYAGFLIYLPIAFFAPLIGFLNYKINPAVLISLGIIGYSLYAFGMIIFPNLWFFYFLQILLGVSASLFFVSSRTVLMSSPLESPDRSFAWFYSAPSYASAIAPAVGALLIWRFDFLGVLILSVAIQIFTALFALNRLKTKEINLIDNIKIKESGSNYLKVLAIVKNKNILPFVFISFLILVLAGFNNTFFILFLKSLDWPQNQILFFNSLLYLVFLPVSFWVIKQAGKSGSEKNISLGGQIAGIFSILMGGLAGVLNFYLIFFIMLGKYIGSLIAGSGRSGLLSTKLKEYPKESAAVDTIFSPLATAIGSIIGGLIIGSLGYPLIFVMGGVLISGAGIFGVVKSKSLR